MNDQSTLEITPQTRLASLLQAYPQLEKVLLELSPAFAKLNNPVLRNTIARVATLQQVAQVGGLSLGEFINRLRAEVGMDRIEVNRDEKDDLPQGFDEARIVRSFDARQMLAAGGHPLQQVLTDIVTLRPGEFYELITPFLPAPLIDVVKKKGYRVFSRTIDAETVKTYIALQE